MGCRCLRSVYLRAEYWNQAEAIVGACPSTLRIILPEIYLDKKDAEQRIENINRTMVRYIDENILEDIGPPLFWSKEPFLRVRFEKD